MAGLKTADDVEIKVGMVLYRIVIANGVEEVDRLTESMVVEFRGERHIKLCQVKNGVAVAGAAWLGYSTDYYAWRARCYSDRVQMIEQAAARMQQRAQRLRDAYERDLAAVAKQD